MDKTNGVKVLFQSLNRDQPLCNSNMPDELWCYRCVSIAQSRPAPLQHDETGQRALQVRLFQSLNRDQPLCNVQNYVMQLRHLQ